MPEPPGHLTALARYIWPTVRFLSLIHNSHRTKANVHKPVPRWLPHQSKVDLRKEGELSFPVQNVIGASKKYGATRKRMNKEKKATKDWIVWPPVSMLQLQQARNAGIYIYNRGNTAFGLIGDCRIFATMTLYQRTANPPRAVLGWIAPWKSLPTARPCIFTHLLDRAASGLASLRTRSEILDIPATAITTPWAYYGP